MLISAPGGSGTTFLIKIIRNAGFKCSRVDAYSLRKVESNRNDPKMYNAKWIKRKTKIEAETAGEAIQEIFRRVNTKNSIPPVYLFQTWGGRGLLDNIDYPIIWVLRDPLQCYTSVAKPGQHGRDFGTYIGKKVKPGYEDTSYMNDKRVLDSWLSGPLQYYKGQIHRALKVPERVLRYEHMAKDLKSIFRKMSLLNKNEYAKIIVHLEEDWKPKTKEITDFINEKSITYIKKQTQEYYDWKDTWTLE